MKRGVFVDVIKNIYMLNAQECEQYFIKLIYFIKYLLLLHYEKNMAQQNQLIVELIEFMKSIFVEFDTLVIELNQTSFYEELVDIGYDGTIMSILFNEYFWDTIMSECVQFYIIFQKLIRYDFVAIEKTIEGLQPFMVDIEFNQIQSVNINLWDYLIDQWTDTFKEPIREWTQNTFGICPK